MAAINKWDHLTDEDLVELVKKHRTLDTFRNANGLPHYKTVLRRLKANKWSELLLVLSVPKNPAGVYNRNKPSLFYVLSCEDTDDTKFIKYGTTQGSLGSRYKAYVDHYDVLYSKKMDLDSAQLLEGYCAALNEFKYVPKSINFQASRHGGFSECLRIEAAPIVLQRILEHGQF